MLGEKRVLGGISLLVGKGMGVWGFVCWRDNCCAGWSTCDDGLPGNGCARWGGWSLRLRVSCAWEIS